MTINGLIQGCLPIMRFNYGAGNLKRLQSVFRYSTILVTSLMMFGTFATNVNNSVTGNAIQIPLISNAFSKIHIIGIKKNICLNIYKKQTTSWICQSDY